MKQQLTLQAANEKFLFSGNNVTIESFYATVSNLWSEALDGVACFYSHILGEKISIPQASAIVQAQVAFLAVILFSCGPMTPAVLSVAWFVRALLKCRSVF